MKKLTRSAPPAVHSSSTSAPSTGPSTGVKGPAPAATPAPSTPKPSSASRAPGQTTQFSAPKPKYADPYAQGKPPSPQQQAAYTTSTKSVGYGGATKAPPHVFIPQPHGGPDSKLCAYYALCHLKNKELDKGAFLKTATAGLSQAMEAQGFPSELAQEMAGPMVHDGGDPSLFGVEDFKLSHVTGDDLKHKGGGIVANVVTGHFFTVKKEGDKWVSYDSYNHSKPKQYDSFEQLKQAEFKQANTGVKEEKLQFWVER